MHVVQYKPQGSFQVLLFEIEKLINGHEFNIKNQVFTCQIVVGI